ncbi:MAG TPA: sulfite exporter TauE/SafE family protein, partial [Pseudomonadota bacterium]|nr:sulfite exporter TauE/SafE family protein [Pseudomonadota bacterium]
AVGTSLLVIAMQAFAGSLGYLGHSTVDFRLVGMLASVMAVGSLGGAVLSQRVPAAFLRRLFAALLIAVAIQMLVQTFF